MADNPPDRQPFAGRVIAVTGAARGLGRAYAIHLARLGAMVVVNNRDSSLRDDTEPTGPVNSSEAPESPPSAQAVAREIASLGGIAVDDSADIAKPGGAEALLQRALDAFGTVHGLVNNAATLRDASIIDMTDEEWTTVLDGCVTGHFYPLRAFARYWNSVHSTGLKLDPAVVNTTSGAGLFGLPNHINYVAAKAAVAAMTIAAAKELEGLGIRVNCVSPGARTRWTLGEMPGAGADLRHVVAAPEDSSFDRWSPDNVAPVVSWLLSPECTETRQVLRTAGGSVAVMDGWREVFSVNRDYAWTVVELADALQQCPWPRSLQKGDRMRGSFGGASPS